MNGGTLIFDTDIPAATLAEGYISVDTLVVGAVTTWKGRNYKVNKGGISQGELTGGGNLNVTGERWLSRGLMHATMR